VAVAVVVVVAVAVALALAGCMKPPLIFVHRSSLTPSLSMLAELCTGRRRTATILHASVVRNDQGTGGQILDVAAAAAATKSLW
jgi:hypothetical protein